MSDKLFVLDLRGWEWNKLLGVFSSLDDAMNSVKNIPPDVMEDFGSSYVCMQIKEVSMGIVNCSSERVRQADFIDYGAKIEPWGEWYND